MKAVKPLDVQESVSADSEAPDIMFICSMVDYGIHTYIESFCDPRILLPISSASLPKLVSP